MEMNRDGLAAPRRSVTPDANACRTPAFKNNTRASFFLITAVGALTNGRPTLARAEVVFVLPIETYDPTSERTQPADALRCFPAARNQMAAISSCNMTCWQGASSAYGRGEATARKGEKNKKLKHQLTLGSVVSAVL